MPFTVTIPKAEQDRSLKQKLREELPGILNWALEGCREWQRQGLNEPEAIRGATDAYRQEMDSLKDFLAECCTEGDKSLLKAMYEAYQKWCESSGETPMKKKVFKAQLVEREFDCRPGKGNQVYAFGVSLNRVI